MYVHAIVIAIAPSTMIVPRRTHVSALPLSLTLNRSKSFRVVFTVRTLAADSKDESADDITAAATDASPKVCQIILKSTYV